MNVLSLLYTLLIGPLELFFEVIYVIASRVLHDPGLAIIFLSLAMNFLVLPLYRRADAMQEAERERSVRMKPWTDHIKTTFKGDERFMMLQTYNRENGYKPTDALKGSISLLLEIPFFIAAYHFLSNLESLRGVSFGPLADLGAPDALLTIGDVSINVLPIIMTALNLLSAVIYMKGLPLSNKIQMFGIAGIFLILLYNSPSGLVFYWTLNNLFSLIKNIFYKLENPRYVLSALAAIVGALLPIVAVVGGIKLTLLRIAILVLVCIALFMPLLFYKKHGFANKLQGLASFREAKPEDDKTFLLICIFLAVLTGLLIPSAVIAASPAEFVDATTLKSPLWPLAQSFALAAGTFIIWFSVFYHLATPKAKTALTYFVFALALIAIVNYLFFGTHYGELSPQLEFDATPKNRTITVALNALLATVIIGVVFYFAKKGKTAWIKLLSVSMCIVVLTITTMNFVNISSQYTNIKEAMKRSAGTEAHINLSTKGNNVVVIMLDRAISYFVPYIMNEKPELKKQFAGFTYYPNSLSYGVATNTGAPALYGGPDYTPKEINNRPNMLLGDKHDEALRVMPTLFSGNNYNVTIFDPTYAGYLFTPDLTVFDDIPNTSAYITMDGSYSLDVDPEGYTSDIRSTQLETLQSRNYFCYSIFKIAPLFAQGTLYNKGTYNSATSITYLNKQVRKNSSIGEGADETFLTSYGVLENLPSITRIKNDNENNFLMMSNDTTHSPVILKEPEYVPAYYVDNTEFDKAHPVRYTDDGDVLELPVEKGGNKNASKVMQYQINMATFLKLGEWFDYLRENGAYDNTRIILVSDHGGRLLKMKENRIAKVTNDKGETTSLDTMGFDCLFMVKDFDSQTFETDTRFMTTADTPILATRDIIKKPENPFTNSPLDESYKDTDVQYLFFSSDWDIDTNNGNAFLPGYWFTFKDTDIQDENNWAFDGWY